MPVDCDSFFDDYGCVFTMCHGYQSPFPIVRLGSPHTRTSLQHDKEVTAITLARGAKQGTLRRLLSLDFDRKDNCMCFLNLLSSQCKPIPLDEEALFYTYVSSHDRMYAYSAHISDAESDAVSSFAVLYHNHAGGVAKSVLPHTSCVALSQGVVWCLQSHGMTQEEHTNNIIIKRNQHSNPDNGVHGTNNITVSDSDSASSKHYSSSKISSTNYRDTLHRVKVDARMPPIKRMRSPKSTRIACFSVETIYARTTCEPLWSTVLSSACSSKYNDAHSSGLYDVTECSSSIVAAAQEQNPCHATVLHYDAVYYLDTRQRDVAHTIELHTAPLLRGALSGEYYLVYYTASDGTLRVLDRRRPNDPLMQARDVFYEDGVVDVRAHVENDVALLISDDQVMVMHVPSLSVVAAQPFSEGSALDAVVLGTTSNSVELCSSSASGMLYHLKIRY